MTVCHICKRLIHGQDWWRIETFRPKRNYCSPACLAADPDVPKDDQ